MATVGSRPLRAIIRALGSANGQDLDYAIVQAAQILDQEARFRRYEEILANPSSWSGLPSDYRESYQKSIRADSSHFLPPSLVGRRLESDEEAALTAALVQLLDRGVRVASVLFALGKGGNQALISRIADEVRRQIGRDAWAIHQGAYVLEDLLYVPRGQRRLTRSEAAIFEKASAVLGAAVTVELPYPPSSPERGYVPDPREAVTQVLAVLCDRFQPKRRRQGFGRWSPGDRLRVRVEQVDALSNGDLALAGPTYADVTQPQLQARAVVMAPDQPANDATFVGLHFNVGVWPPQRKALLRGLTAGAVPVGTLISAVDAEERELIVGINRGDLQRVSRFGTVVREGLQESEFLLLYKAAADIRIPERTPDLERRARWERMQAQLAHVTRRP